MLNIIKGQIAVQFDFLAVQNTQVNTKKPQKNNKTNKIKSEYLAPDIYRFDQVQNTTFHFGL